MPTASRRVLPINTSCLVRKGLPITLTERIATNKARGREVRRHQSLDRSQQKTDIQVGPLRTKYSRGSAFVPLARTPLPVHSLHYALMHHNVTSCDLDVIACASHKGVELGHRVFALVGKCQVERYP